MSDIQDLISQAFWIPIHHEDVDWDLTCLKEEKNYRLSNHQQRAKVNNKNVSTYTKTLRILEKYPELKNKILDKFLDYLSAIGFDNLNCVITTSWLTRLDKGQAVDPHCHQNCMFSGILYYDDDYSDAPPLEFHNPFFSLNSFGVEPSEPNGFTSNFILTPRPKLLSFFPSYLAHSVQPTVSNIPRRSMAFNLHPIGFFGDGDSTLSTRWLNF
tara:strand:+ start:140 stop:778 length:639 start_codon:yes stop_codon:yes gene_type:complete